jgi:hypothetical protein
MEKKELPQELIDIWIEYSALDQLKEDYVKKLFGYKKAVKCAKDAERKRWDFWDGVFALYPEVRGGKGWKAQPAGGIIYREDEEE